MDELALVTETVERTLRAAADWFPPDMDSTARNQPALVLRRVADDVSRQGADEMCCVVCEEVRCDPGCPFENYREVNKQ